MNAAGFVPGGAGIPYAFQYAVKVLEIASKYRKGEPWLASGGTTNAWATSHADSRLLGMGVGRVDPGAGTYHIRNLHAGSRYTIVAGIDGVSRQWLGEQPTVKACSSTRFDLYF